MKESFQDNFVFDMDAMKAAGSECRSAAVETSTMCTTTTTKAKELVAYGLEMKAALEVFSDGIDMEDFTTLHGILDQDKMNNALTLANEMDELALSCANHSVRMIESIDAGIETLPDILEKNVDKRMENAQSKGSQEGDAEIPDLEEGLRTPNLVEDLRALKNCATKVCRPSRPLSKSRYPTLSTCRCPNSSTRCQHRRHPRGRHDR